MHTDDFDFQLPPELIAQAPLAERDASRLLHVRRPSGALQHRAFRELPSLLRKGDLLVFNDSRVIPARLLGKKKGTGGKAELLLIRPSTDVDTEAALKSAAGGSVWVCLGQLTLPGGVGDEAPRGKTLHPGDLNNVVDDGRLLATRKQCSLAGRWVLDNDPLPLSGRQEEPRNCHPVRTPAECSPLRCGSALGAAALRARPLFARLARVSLPRRRGLRARVQGAIGRTLTLTPVPRCQRR